VAQGDCLEALCAARRLLGSSKRSLPQHPHLPLQIFDGRSEHEPSGDVARLPLVTPVMHDWRMELHSFLRERLSVPFTILH
jgi:hypothetical protein